MNIYSDFPINAYAPRFGKFRKMLSEPERLRLLCKHRKKRAVRRRMARVSRRANRK